ncbi:MAG: Ser-Thr-rich GPI-anchored membrane family protein, partial [Candidatus Paceibacterota bacterium]
MKKYIVFLIILSVLIIGVSKASAESVCEEKTITESALRGASSIGYWWKLGTNIPAGSEASKVLRYRIQWFSGNWSPWYVPGESDIDSVKMPDGTDRRIWSYFDDHNHQYVKCAENIVVPVTPSVKILTPNGGETLTAGQQVTIKWSTQGIPSNDNVYISLGAYFSGYPNGAAVRVLAHNVPNTGSYTVELPADQMYYGSAVVPFGNNFKIYIQQAGLHPTYWDYSDNLFSINTAPVVTPSIKILSPNGGEVFTVGQQIKTTWSSQNMSSSEEIYFGLIKDGNGVYYSLTGGTSNDGYQVFTIPSDIQAGQYKMHVRKADTTIEDFSDNLFTINGVPVTTASIKVLSPNGGETWTKGTTQMIKWQDNTAYTCQIGIPCIQVAPVPRNFNLKLIPNSCSPGNNCIMNIPQPYYLADNVTSPYSWEVGRVKDLNGGLVPNGSYTLQVCDAVTESRCDSSDSYFKINSSSTKPPVISGVSGSQTLNVNQTGTWTVKAS